MSHVNPGKGAVNGKGGLPCVLKQSKPPILRMAGGATARRFVTF